MKRHAAFVLLTGLWSTAGCTGGLSSQAGRAPEGGADAGIACVTLSACCATLNGASQKLCESVAIQDDADNCTTELGQLQSQGGCDSFGPPPVVTDAGASRPADATCPGAPASVADASCYASCCIPAGTVEPFTTVPRVYEWLIGRWQFCSGTNFWHGFGPLDAIGVEFEAPPAAGDGGGDAGLAVGNLYFLVQGPSGPVRGAGFAYQWTYDVLGFGSSFQLDLNPRPNSSAGSSVRYSPCPTELEIEVNTAGNGGTLVPFY